MKPQFLVTGALISLLVLLGVKVGEAMRQSRDQARINGVWMSGHTSVCFSDHYVKYDEDYNDDRRFELHEIYRIERIKGGFLIVLERSGGITLYPTVDGWEFHWIDAFYDIDRKHTLKPGQ